MVVHGFKEEIKFLKLSP